MSDSMRAEVPGSIEVAYRRYFPLIRAKCQRMLTDNDEAQDIAQETFIRLWRSGLAGQEGDSVAGWIYRTSTRLAIDRLRSRRSESSVRELPLPPPETRSPVETRAATRQQLARVARELSPEALELLVMERLDGMTQDEIAVVLGVSARTVRRLARKVDQKLARLAPELA